MIAHDLQIDYQSWACLLGKEEFQRQSTTTLQLLEDELQRQ